MSKTKRDIRSSEKHSSSSCTSSLSSDEEIDARDLKLIKEYLPNRKELAHQLFKSVKVEKIFMMLPQVLKPMDMNELEQWCVSELNGMSKTRILCVLNNKPMLESSDTSDSDNSGPSLEIISDTEEWLTDDDASKKEDDGRRKLKRSKMRVKGKTQANKTNDLNKSNVKGKCGNKNGNSDQSKYVKIKKEDDKDKDKDKEGDSLLDLLELEMRARAIRALIRKEEDVPSTNMDNLPQTNSDQALKNNIKMLQDDAEAKENCRKQLERIINAKQGNIGEDEDVVLVVQPMPVVELSSESDREDYGERINQGLESEHIAEIEKSKDDSQEGKETQETGIHTNAMVKADLNSRSEARTIMSERNVDIRNNILSISISASNVAEKRKKSKKRSHAKTRLTSSNDNIHKDSPKLRQVNTTEIIEQSSDVTHQDTNEQSNTSPISDEKEITLEEENNENETTVKKNRVEEEKLADLDEIIDLDAYCDVMDIENCDEDKSQDKIIAPIQQSKESVSQTASNKVSESLETWASRYYQTDDVQNVIKDSKIQSEIRKRLRERQRLSKLQKSPSLNLSSPANQTASVASDKAPTGSVEEYLALKRATNVDVSDTSNNNNTVQDIPASVDSNNDVITKENSAQDESSQQISVQNLNDAMNVDSIISCSPDETVIQSEDRK